MLIKKDFINSLVRILLDDEYKANVDSLFYDMTYLFTYNVKTTELEEFLDPQIIYIDNYQVCTSVAIEMQVQS